MGEIVLGVTGVEDEEEEEDARFGLAVLDGLRDPLYGIGDGLLDLPVTEIPSFALMSLLLEERRDDRD